MKMKDVSAIIRLLGASKDGTPMQYEASSGYNHRTEVALGKHAACENHASRKQIQCKYQANIGL